jgi:NADPH2:quinone reductase
MRALLCTNPGPDVILEIDEVPDLVPGPGEVVIQVEAAGLNFPDTLIVQGKYQFKPEPPFSPGAEAAGVVAAAGEGVHIAVGTPVVALGVYGAFAEQWVVPAATTMPLPTGMGFEQAAGFGLTYGTAYYALKQRGRLGPGETLLVLGAAGGVGSAAVQIGKAMGATVIAAASSPEKLAFASDCGADLTIDYSHEDLKTGVRELTDGHGADVVFDPVGGDMSEPALRATAWDGRFLVVGFAAGDIPRIPLNLALLKGLHIIGVFWGSWVGRDPLASSRNYEELFEMVASGAFALPAVEVYALEDHASAFAALKERRAKGKVVLRTGL